MDTLVFTTVILKGFGHASSPSSDNHILLLGMNGSGKTTLFYLLRDHLFPKVVTSLVPNEGTVCFGQHLFRLTDYPGHPRLQSKLHSHLVKAGMVIWLLDSSTMEQDIIHLSDFLYEVLAQLIATHNRKRTIKFIFACNKQDVKTAMPPSDIKRRLETEIERVSRSRYAAVSKQGAEDSRSETFSLDGWIKTPFNFNQLPITISFVACSLRQQTQELEQVMFGNKI